VGDEETLTLPFGILSTIKLSRQPRREFDQKVEIWYAPSLGYLPVRSKITQHNGDFVDQQLSALSQS
jgi:acyl-CoA hydrolase